MTALRQLTSAKMFTLAQYTFAKRPSPALCEAMQRALDRIDPRYVLHVEGTHAEVVGPLLDTSAIPGLMYDFVEAMKATDTLAEWQRRAARRSHP